jgi:hypothetical protein
MPKATPKPRAPEPEERTGRHEFQLTDADGNLHDYLVTEHPAGDGTEIVFELLGLGAPTALQLAGAALTSDDLLRAILGVAGGAGFNADTGAAALAELADIDFGKAGGEIQRAFGTGKAPMALVRKLVSRAWRDGQKVAEVYDQAYQANYWELAQLVGKIIAINRFFPVPPTSAS